VFLQQIKVEERRETRRNYVATVQIGRYPTYYIQNKKGLEENEILSYLYYCYRTVHKSLIKTTISKMKFCIAATLAASAAAFAPSKVAQTATSLNAFEAELGAQAPLGFFDPLGLLDGADQSRFDRLRYVELKHGRISQLAFLGQIVNRAGIHLPGNIDSAGTSFESIPAGFKALDAMPVEGIYQIVGFVGILELYVMTDLTGEAEFAGDFRNGAIDFGWDNFDEETKLQKRAIELNQGRAAMMGILGLMVHEQLGGSLPIVGEM
jgi:hypothetical protein